MRSVSFDLGPYPFTRTLGPSETDHPGGHENPLTSVPMVVSVVNEVQGPGRLSHVLRQPWAVSDDTGPVGRPLTPVGQTTTPIWDLVSAGTPPRTRTPFPT